MYVLPGGVDVHVHSRDPGFTEKEDFGTLTEAAAAGGVTTVLDMPNTVPAVDSAGVLESKAALARSKARVDFGLWGLLRSSTTPEQLESMAAAAAAAIARESGVHMHVAHLSSALGLRAAEDAIQVGTSLSLETCPQFLLLTAQDFDRVGTAMKMLPPIRTAADRDALVDGLKRGVISIVSTDHAPHTDEEKSQDFERAPAGSPGVQTLY